MTDAGELILDGVRTRPVVGFPGYRVSDGGRLFTASRRARYGQKADDWKPLRTRPNQKTGYLTTNLRRDGRNVTILVHRLVLEAFVGPCPEGMECLHADDDRANVILGNLKWGTHSENMTDCFRRNGPNVGRGESHPNATVTESQVREARALRATGLSYREIGRRLGLKWTTVRRVITRQWKYLNGAQA